LKYDALKCIIIAKKNSEVGSNGVEIRGQ